MASHSRHHPPPSRGGSAPPPAAGSIVAGTYRILRPLGEGGMGAVFEAEHIITLKRAAIKWVHPRVQDIPQASRRLILEARAAARVRHRNVIQIFDAVVEGDSLFLVMELLLGEPLDEYIARGRFTVPEVIAMLLPAMRGVAAAHAAGVIHRDIKPQNIFLARESDGGPPLPKVIDFGISRILAGCDERLTSSGITMGTPRYVCFEQLRGARDVDGRADIYGFGVILYETIVGRPPYDAASFGAQAINFVTTSPPEPKAVRPNVPDALNALLLAAIAKDRDERLASMDEFIRALAPFASADAFPQGNLAAFPPRPGSQQTNPVDPAQTTVPEGRAPIPVAGPVTSGLVRSSPAPALVRRSLRARALLVTAVMGAGLSVVWGSRAPEPAPSLPPTSALGGMHEQQSTASQAPAAAAGSRPISQPPQSTPPLATRAEPLTPSHPSSATAPSVPDTAAARKGSPHGSRKSRTSRRSPALSEAPAPAAARTDQALQTPEAARFPADATADDEVHRARPMFRHQF